MASITAFESGKTRVSGYVIDNGRAVMVSLVDAADGWVTVQAFDGQPFEHPHYGTTDTITIPAYRFNPLFQRIDAKPSNLLGLALAAAKPQWSAGESVELIGSGRSLRAWLKNNGGIITLNIAGYRPGIPVYLLTANGEWKTARNLENSYKTWAAKAQHAIETRQLASKEPKSNRPVLSGRRAR